MSARTTQKAETAHGTIEYQTVTCDSCGNEMLEDDAEPFMIGDRRGVACPHCVDEGPVSFPKRTLGAMIQGPGTDHADDNFWFTFFMGWIVLPMCVLASITDGDNAIDFVQGAGWATITLLAYAGFAVGMWVLI